MKHKVSELEGTLLDVAVALADGGTVDTDGDRTDAGFREGGAPVRWSPSTRWDQGGPIIEREGIELVNMQRGAVNPIWAANIWRVTLEIGDGDLATRGRGRAPLIAAMRCFVASKFGDEIELP